MTQSREQGAPGEPTSAATVILLRGGPLVPLEVLLMRRPRGAGAFADVYAFAGGKLEAQDEEAARLLGPESYAAQIARLLPTPGKALPRETALAFYLCACRELFEETGVLLARRKDGGALALDDAQRPDLLAARRELLLGHTSFFSLLNSRGLVPALERLAFWAHWVTPSAEPRRFDARFFIATLPDGQDPTLIDDEAVRLLWASPREAIEQALAGTIRLPPPTVRNLEDLSIATTPAVAWELAQVRRIAAILPKVVAREDGTTAILLPWDPLYADAPGEALPMAMPHPMAAGASRLVLRDGIWHSESAAPLRTEAAAEPG